MKTTELFVEQLIIGIAVVLTAAVMVWPEFAAELYRNGAIDLSKVAFVLAGAYLVGIVYDRVADSMLQDLEQHHRLLYALGKIYKAQDERKHRYEPEPVDRFPEGKWRTRVMGAGGAAEHADYLRSRIRLTRALTTMIPAMAVAGALAEGKTTARAIAGLTVLAVYLIAFVSKIARREPLPKPWTTLEEKTEYEWPRTHRVSEEDVRKWYEDRIEYD
ncbi:MAG TPA: hypothetical protein VJ694_03650, partial [Patescibacteria group bacterium]|nr:hypothetical protein [Patescibacteria group bacterium]